MNDIHLLDSAYLSRIRQSARFNFFFDSTKPSLCILNLSKLHFHGHSHRHFTRTNLRLLFYYFLLILSLLYTYYPYTHARTSFFIFFHPFVSFIHWSSFTAALRRFSRSAVCHLAGSKEIDLLYYVCMESS